MSISDSFPTRSCRATSARRGRLARFWRVGVAVVAAGLPVEGFMQGAAGREKRLETAVQVRELSAEEAKRRHPVRLRGVVTVVFLRGTFFVQDDTGGLLISTNLDTSQLDAGDWLEIEGHSDYGFMVPRVVPVNWRRLGRAPMPRPVRIGSDELVAGRHVSEWVELEGVVRGAVIGTERLCMLRVDTGARVVEVQLVRGTLEEARSLVDARVAVRGVVAGYVNERRQVAVHYLRASGMGNVDVLEQPLEDVFALPATPSNSLMMFSARGYTGHRVKIRGIVSGHQAGRALYLRDGEQSIVTYSEQEGVLRPGDVAEVAGFPEMGPTIPRLHDAVFRRVEGGPAPAPREVKRDDLLRGLLDGDLVTLEARLLNVARTPAELMLVLEFGDMTVRARFDPPPGFETPWVAGSRVRVTGICRVERARMPSTNIKVAAQDVELWLRDPVDVVVRQPAAWWTMTRLLVAMALAVVVALAALAWVAMLRRRVHEQTEIIRGKIQNEAVAEERQRIAREFHDTLEQELTGLAVRLDALQVRVADTANAGLVGALQRLAHRLQDEARHFIWNLRERRWENTTLGDALADAVSERHADDAVKIEFACEGEAQRLPGVVSHHLLRIGQEAVTNAVQHAGATSVRVTLAFRIGSVTLTVEDDGRGFEASSVTERRTGHFGLTGMRERARRIGGELQLRSAPGDGTTVAVHVAVTARERIHA